MGVTALSLPGVTKGEFLHIVAIHFQAERQREESKLSTTVGGYSSPLNFIWFLLV